MEVHHHPIAIGSHSHNKKKWTEYFWEFFMLFLAVSLGFMVENGREHYIEHQRAKIYARTMVANLASDTAELDQIIYRGEFAVSYLDSFLNLVSKNEISAIPTGKLYWYGLWGGYFRGFESNDATFQQMRSSGSLRYFDNNELEQKISEYDKMLRSLKTLNEIDQTVYLETRKARARIFDFKYNNDANTVVRSAVYTKFDQSRIDSFIHTNPPLLTTDKIVFNEYAELCRTRNIKQQQLNTKIIHDLAAEIIVLLKKRYHLE